ncbi:alpha-amylase family glycosyl hydrolase [Changchengzhania lutea]|uniref:alpha-amylase family glycosyl hydrolase n=1 Tax=Changchengzhania lutea TaxID=2049305 RepID=UPI00115ECF3D|nr:alpha-amylase family glycosyl hydrolase [Changchengzhania lutea]
MKKLYLILLLFVSTITSGQVITVTPSAFEVEQSITITVDVNSNATDCNGFASPSKVYMHSGIGDDSNAWGFSVVGNWGQGDGIGLMTNNGDGTWSITMTPKTYYNLSDVDAGNATMLGMVFRNEDGTQELKDNGCSDFFINIGAFQLALNSPTDDITILNAGESLSINATTSLTANFVLKANGTQVDAQNNITNYTYNFVVNENTLFVLEATEGTNLLSKNFQAVVSPTVTEAPVPSGLKDGINLDPNNNTKATLVLYAPNKTFVHVIGDFNNWTIDDNYVMNKDSANNRFWIELTGLTPQFDHMYQYLVDFEINIADPYSTLILDEGDDPFINNTTFPNLPVYPSGLTTEAITLLRTGDPDFNWQVTNFQKPEKTDLVIYELLVRDFDELHSFDAVKARLDYLEDLGINAIELMPVSEFDGNLSWGYNPSFHMALDKYYGTATAFKQLIDACHSRGIAVILDVVYNHASGQHPFYRMWNTDNGGFGGQATAENPFFNATATHAYSVFNDFNHQSDATKQYVERTVKYWLEEYKIDGFRWDLTKGFTQNCTSNDEGCTNGLQQDRVDVLKAYADYQWEVDPNFYVIFEHLGGISEEKQWADYRATEGKGILMWNKQTDLYNEATMGFHDGGKSNFSGVSYTVKGFDGPSAVSYMESHDEQRLMYKNLTFGNSNGSYSVKNLNTALHRMKAAGAFFFTVPGPKMIWQFGELGYEVDIEFNGRTGDKPIRWEYVTIPERKAIYDTWADLINLKLNEPIFETTDFTIDASSSTGLKTIHLSLASAGSNEIKYVTIIGNFGVTPQDIVPNFQQTGTWYEFLNGNLNYEVTNTSSTISLAPGEFRIFGDNKSSLFPDNNIPDDDNDGVPNALDLCANTPFGAVVDVNGCEVFSLPSNNFALQVTNETCRTSNNGSISIAAIQNLNYSIKITGNGTTINDTFNTDLTVNNLEAGDYLVCIQVEGQADYEQCFNITITEPEDLSVFSKTSNDKKSIQLEMSGSSSYTITLNGETFQTSQSSINLELQAGSNMITVAGEKNCQGTYEEVIYSGVEMSVFPNPITNNTLHVYLGDLDSETAKINVYSILGRQVYTNETNKSVLNIDASNFSKGIYILNVHTKNEKRSFKIIKN